MARPSFETRPAKGKPGGKGNMSKCPKCGKPMAYCGCKKGK